MSKAAKAYSNNQVETDISEADPIKLILLVYDKIFENLRLGKIEISEDKHGIEYFTKASDLINSGLLIALDLNKGGKIAEELDLIYRWALRKLILARIEKSTDMIDEIISVLAPLHEAWLIISSEQRKPAVV